MLDINITKNDNGSLTLATVHDGHRVAMTYYFLSTREALADFKQYLQEL